MFPGKPPRGQWESWSLLAALSASTTRLQLGPLVSCTGFRNPALLAKMADTVDEISGGRLILGLGAGDHGPEHLAFGFPFEGRIGRFEEAFTITQTLLRQGRVDFAGSHYQARDCELRLRGPRAGRIPILVGALATGPRMLRLTARFADMWNAWLVWGDSAPTAVPPLRAAVDAACLEVGRDPATLQRTVCVRVDLPGREGRPGSKVKPLTGSPEELAEAFHAFAREGISHVQVVLNPNSIAGIEEFAPVLSLLDRG